MKAPLSPRYWPVYFGFGLLRLAAKLPYGVQMALGRGLGRLLRRLLGSRQRVAARNLELCFPELSDAERSAMLDRLWQSIGCMVFEVGMAWWASDRAIQKLMVKATGFEHFDQAMADGEGVLLLAPHLTHLELGGRMLCQRSAISKAGLYRRHGNDALEYVVKSSRLGYADRIFIRRQTRAAVKHLRQGGLLWFAPDQDYERGESVFVPFFGVDAYTTVSPLQLARLGRARILTVGMRRLPDNGGYELEISPPLEGIPSDDPITDATRINAALETHIRRCPEQYLWLHRRFKNRPEGQPSLY
jgi:KDO2-lipid IV(A) lauroyltransferase